MLAQLVTELERPAGAVSCSDSFEEKKKVLGVCPSNQMDHRILKYLESPDGS